VKLRHCSEVCGEHFTVTGLQRCDEEIDASLVRLLTSSNFIVFPFLPFPACFFLHLSGSGKKKDGKVKGTERRPREGGTA
jgi:hypothetical protein